MRDRFYPKEQDKELTLLCANEAVKNNEYHMAQKFLMRCSGTNDQAASLLKQWMQNGQPDEKDLFVARFILLKLAVNRIDDAKVLCEEFKKEIKSPLLNFVGNLV